MLTQINATSFGCFSDFQWSAVRDPVGNNIVELNKVNLIYGRNYSGKTTLSKILRSFEMHQLPENYDSPQFSISIDQTTLSQDDLVDNPLDIRVYNSDFVQENLSFLKDSSSGDVKSFALIGKANKDLEKEITELETKLGSVEGKSGLLHQQEIENQAVAIQKATAQKAENSLNDKLKKHANQSIKTNALLKVPTYNITKIKEDIRHIEKQGIASVPEEETTALQDLLKESPLPHISETYSFSPLNKTDLDEIRELVERSIAPTTPIQDLLNDSVLQAWVRDGIDIHKDKRERCGFCGNIVPEDLWSKLGKHFDEQSIDLDNEISVKIEKIESSLKTAQLETTIEKGSFYKSYQSSFVEKVADLKVSLQSYRTVLRSLVKILKSRKNDIFSPKDFPEAKDFSGQISKQSQELNELIESNNNRTATLSNDQATARKALRIQNVLAFTETISLAKLRQDIVNENQTLQNKIAVLTATNSEVLSLLDQITKHRVQLKSEKIAATRINQYLNHYFGHDFLSLEAIASDDNQEYKFQILRDGVPAYNLSEGECSLISFCYFIAKLQEVETSQNSTIIFIDDPISSLDNNHIFFVFSLIESLIAKPNIQPDGTRTWRYKQLFISTHNLEFLKYLKRMSSPQNGRRFFLVERNDVGSCVRVMPSHLSNYTTEFNYLFEQILICSDKSNSDAQPHVFYSFGNNLRKFLEAYLFFKFPVRERGDLSPKIQKFFGDDVTSSTLIMRISNELSHSEDFDRGTQPIDYDEISKTAKFVLDSISQKDPSQYEALMQSIGQ